MNAVPNAQIWHRRLDHLNRRSLELIQRHDGNGITFDGTIADCDVCVVGKDQQLAHPKKAQHAGITRPFQLCYGDLIDPFTPEAYGGFKYVSNITDQFTRWTAVYLLENESCAFDSFRLFVSSTVIPCGGRVICWRADKGGEYTSKVFKQYCLKTGITQEFAATNTLSNMACPSALAGPFAVWFAAFSSKVDSGPSCGGSSCSLRLTAETVCHTSGLTWRHRSSGYTVRRPICCISRSSALELSSTSRMPRSWNPSPEKECCAASARTKRYPTGYGTRKLAGWWRAGT